MSGVRSLLASAAAVVLCLAALLSSSHAQPSFFNSPQLSPQSYSDVSYIPYYIAAADNSSSGGAAFFSLDSSDGLLTSVDPSGRILAFSSLCMASPLYYASDVFYCASLDPRPHGPLLWTRVQRFDGSTYDYTCLSQAFNATSLNPVTTVRDADLTPPPTIDLINSYTAGSICTDSANTAYLLGYGEVWVIAANGTQVNYWLGPGVTVPTSNTSAYIGAFDPSDTLWLLNAAPVTGTANFSVWRTLTTGVVVNAGVLSFPGVTASASLQVWGLSVDSMGLAYVTITDLYDDSQAAFFSIYIFDSTFDLVATIAQSAAADGQPMISQSVGWGATPASDVLLSLAVGNSTVQVLNTSSGEALGSISPRNLAVSSSTLIQYDPFLDSLIVVGESAELLPQGGSVLAYRFSRSMQLLAVFTSPASISFPEAVAVDGAGYAAMIVLTEGGYGVDLSLVLFFNSTQVWSVDVDDYEGLTMDSAHQLIYAVGWSVDAYTYAGTAASSADFSDPDFYPYFLFPGPTSSPDLIYSVGEDGVSLYSINATSGLVVPALALPQLSEDADELLWCAWDVSGAYVYCSNVHEGYVSAFAASSGSGTVVAEYADFDALSQSGVFTVDPQGEVWLAADDGLVAYAALSTVVQPTSLSSSSSAGPSPYSSAAAAGMTSVTSVPRGDVPDSSNDSSSSSLTGGDIAGVVIAVLIGVALLAVLGFYCFVIVPRRKRGGGSLQGEGAHFAYHGTPDEDLEMAAPDGYAN